jgi:glycerol-1-phosphate dehydrogenase [NAD(P)+]
LILSGPHTRDVAGKTVASLLEDQGYGTTSVIVEKSSLSEVSNITAGIRETGSRFVLGVGGGAVIDVAKLASFHGRVPFISVPTAASHDGISSDRASISDSGKPVSIASQAPLGIIADTEIVSQAPQKLTASGCGDIIAKYTAVRDWKLAHRLKDEYYGEYASNLALMSSRLIVENARTIHLKSDEGLRIVLEALISCGVAMSIAGSSRPCSGSEHLFSHALDVTSPHQALHGEQCGVGAIMMAYLQKGNWRMIRDALKTIGAPTTAEELGIEPTFIVEALTLAHKVRPERYTILGSDGLTVDAAENLARTTGVID